jgi:hypothetical protein
MIVIAELVTLNAAPMVAVAVPPGKRRPQSKIVGSGGGAPLMTSDAKLLISTQDSLKTPALRNTKDAWI